MATLVSKCGIDCGTCPWGPFPRKNMTKEEFEKYRKNAKQILGFMPIKTACVTCQTPDEKIPKTIKLPRKKCLIRQCVNTNRIDNCAYCSFFPCETLKGTADLWTRKKIEEKLERSISEKEYHLFVEPFEGLNRLMGIKSSLQSNEIVKPVKISKSQKRIIKFPEILTNKKISSFRIVYNLLQKIYSSSLGLKNPDTFAQQHLLENQKVHVFRFLWILGNYGKIRKIDSTDIQIDAQTYYANRGKEKQLSILSFIQNVIFEVLSEFGIFCKLEALEGVKQEEITTGTGYLRKKGWLIIATFGEKIGGYSTFKALQTYTQTLTKKYASKAFRSFKKADMTILQ